jgi:hypothetical protein
MTKRGKPHALTPELDALMERLWCETRKTHATIAQEVGASVEYVRNAAKTRGWHRPAVENSVTVEERLRTAAWLRWAGPKREVERVRLVPRGSFPARGFRIGGGAG